MTERQLQQTVIEAARTLGYRAAHFRPAQTQRGRWLTPMQGDVGYPDVTIAGHGKLFYAELKSVKGTTSPQQDRWLEALNEAGKVEAFVLKPWGLDLFLEVLKKGAGK